jgi:hypothetical protein
MAELERIIDAPPDLVVDEVISFCLDQGWEWLSTEDAKRPAFPGLPAFREPDSTWEALYFWKQGGTLSLAGGQRISILVSPSGSGGSVVRVKTQAKALFGTFKEATPDGIGQPIDWGQGRRIAVRLLDTLTRNRR